jgi:MFS family permease
MSKVEDASETTLERNLIINMDENIEGIPKKPLSKLRWTVLALSCVMMIGSYYCFDIPSALKTQIGDYMGTSKSDYENYFALMYSLYAIPNVILPFFGGYFVDKFGQCYSLLVCTIFLALGQCVVAIGFTFKSWFLILSGRFIFALGGENLIVASSALLADWFIGKELAFSFGINLALARVGSVANNYLSVYLTQKLGVTFANWVGAMICGVSVLSVIATIPIDKTMDERIETAKALVYGHSTTLGSGSGSGRNSIEYGSTQEQDNSMIKSPLNSDGYGGDKIRGSDEDSTGKHSSFSGAVINGYSNSNNNSDDDSYTTALKQYWDDCRSLPNIFWVLIGITVIIYGIVVPFNNIASSLLLERSYFTDTPNGCTLQQSGQCQASPFYINNNNPTCDINKNTAPPLPSDITINGQYYSQVVESDVDCGSSVWNGNEACTYTYCNALANSETTVATIMSIPYIISGAASPVFGIFIDYYGLRAFLTWVSSGILVLVHGYLAWSDCSPVLPLIGQGLAYTAFAAVLWPAIPLVVSEELRGLSFGIGTASYNAGCAAVPLIAASVYTQSNNKYIPNVELLFTTMALFSFLLGIYLNYLDSRQFNRVLNKGLIDDDIANSNSNSNSNNGTKENDSERGNYTPLSNSEGGVF